MLAVLVVLVIVFLVCGAAVSPAFWGLAAIGLLAALVLADVGRRSTRMSRFGNIKRS